MSRKIAITLAALFGLWAAVPAHATLLAPSDSDVAAGAVAIPVGSTLDATQTLTASTAGPPKLNISVTEWVYTDKTTGGLDFQYQVKNLATSSTIVERVTVYNFSELSSANVGYNTASGARAPASLDWSGDGSVIGFQFNTVATEVHPGQTSNLLIVKTNIHAPFYTNTGTVTAQDGSVVQVAGYMPTPEPSTMALAGLGALGLIGYGLRRRKAMGA